VWRFWTGFNGTRHWTVSSISHTFCPLFSHLLRFLTQYCVQMFLVSTFVMFVFYRVARCPILNWTLLWHINVLIFFLATNCHEVCPAVSYKLPVNCTFYCSLCFVLVHAVAQLAEALRYKPEGRWFDSRLFQWNFSLFRPHYGPGVESTSNVNEYQEYFLKGKGGRCVALITLPLLFADCVEIWEPQPPGTLRACQGL
jgi:hypothetical protein